MSFWFYSLKAYCEGKKVKVLKKMSYFRLLFTKYLKNLWKLARIKFSCHFYPNLKPESPFGGNIGIKDTRSEDLYVFPRALEY